MWQGYLQILLTLAIVIAITPFFWNYDAVKNLAAARVIDIGTGVGFSGIPNAITPSPPQKVIAISQKLNLPKRAQF